MAELPAILAYEERRLRSQLDVRRKLVQGAYLSTPFDDRGKILMVDQNHFEAEAVKRHVTAVLSYVNAKIRTADDVRMKAALWNEVILAKMTRFYRPEDWRSLLILWRIGEPAPELTRTNLAQLFMRDALGIDDRVLASLLAVDLAVRADPQDSRERLIEVAFTIQEERDNAALFRHYAPRVVIFAAGMISAPSAPVIGAIITALTGFCEFQFAMEDAEVDGEITESELTGVKMALLGILPFRFVQMGLLAAGLGMVGLALLRMLRDALLAFPAWIERYMSVRNAGWKDYTAIPEEAIVIPKYLLRK
ncbi:hypothetical protein A1507_19545 [Methylomonas koyamae]|uniref:Uncharacterized protein n=1 Tax=Methylomonas koyamae TaxID=702114 RepID=A0A177N356_9GAMM|nr:hypothetical protein [Methylomonas koyamae]OAI11903.1 hypothetical protein A1507_19545 [Methylomonas koyamae]